MCDLEPFSEIRSHTYVGIKFNRLLSPVILNKVGLA